MLLGSKNTLGALKNDEKREVIMFIARQCRYNDIDISYNDIIITYNDIDISYNDIVISYNDIVISYNDIDIR